MDKPTRLESTASYMRRFENAAGRQATRDELIEAARTARGPGWRELRVALVNAPVTPTTEPNLPTQQPPASGGVDKQATASPETPTPPTAATAAPEAPAPREPPAVPITPTEPDATAHVRTTGGVTDTADAASGEPGQTGPQTGLGGELVPPPAPEPDEPTSRTTKPVDKEQP